MGACGDFSVRVNPRSGSAKEIGERAAESILKAEPATLKDVNDLRVTVDSIAQVHLPQLEVDVKSALSECELKYQEDIRWLAERMTTNRSLAADLDREIVAVDRRLGRSQLALSIVVAVVALWELVKVVLHIL